jgi:hypothetical protein
MQVAPGHTEGGPKTVAAAGVANMKNIAPFIAAAAMLLPTLAANAADAPAAAPVVGRRTLNWRCVLTSYFLLPVIASTCLDVHSYYRCFYFRGG